MRRLSVDVLTLGSPISRAVSGVLTPTWVKQTLHQRAYGALIRGQSSTDVTIVDLSRALRQAGLRRCLLRHDPLHMTAAGHRLVAEQILSVLQPRLEGSGAPARSSSR
jgi:lysophospholipase L1-like esterase